VADEALLGREIAGYRITGVIGRGGMGVVYLADHLRLGRKVALKLLPAELSQDAGYRARFLRESRLAAALEHPNVVPVHDAGEADGLLYIAMRFVDGRDLRSLLADGPLEPRRALMLAGQIAGALDAAHARGLVHRDVKPGNIVVDDADNAYLTDFGIAVELDSSAVSGGGPGSTAGTLAYVAPEQIEGGPVGGRADQYALACLAYECLTGRPPFAGRGSGMALLWAHLEEPPPAVTDAAPGLPAALNAVLSRGLAKQPEDRFPSCTALIAAVRHALDSATEDALPAALAGPAPPLAGRASELEALREAWLGVHRGDAGALILVSGPRGAGKTRLLAELARELHGGVRVRYASAVGSESELVSALEQPAPALIVVEDLDAARAPILDALEAAARERRVLVAGSFRVAGSADLESLIDRVPHIPLGPLDAEAIRSIAELYAGEDTRDLPVDSVLQASGGMPGSVHELVGEWARGAATRRLQASAGRVAEGRADLRDAEAAVAEDVQALQLIRERARIYFPELAATSGGPPFKGLETFESADADRFFGRERLVAQLVARLAGAPVLCLVGASGSGKSSLLRAGLLPVIAGGAIPGSERWERVVLRPARSGDGLAELLRKPPGSRTLIAIDQLEEIFSRDRTDAEREEFLSALGAVASDPERFVVVLAVRADFYGRIAELPDLAGLVDRHSVLVGPMRPEELRRAIELPASRAGFAVEPALVEVLVREVADRAGSLPLLSTVLLELWQAREGRTLTRAAYERSGGVRGAVSRLAESAYGEMSEPEQAAARAALLRLTDETAPDGAAVRRRVPLSEFDTMANERLRRALEILTNHRLIAVDQQGVEVTHEALLQEWPRLRRWLEEDAEGRRVRRDLREAASNWRSGGRDGGDLYRGARLAATLSWAQRHDPELNALEREYLAESQAVAEQDTRRIERTNSRLRMLLYGVAVLLLAAMAGGIVALVQSDRARDAEQSALAGRLGAEALIDPPLARSVLLARQAVALDDTVQTRSSLLAALLRSPAALRVIPGNHERLLLTAMAPNGRLLAVADNTRSVLLIDPRTYEQAGPALTLPLQAQKIEFSPDSRTLAVSYADPEVGHLRMYDVETRKPGALRRTPGFVTTGIAFSPDGSDIVVGDTAVGDGDPNRVVRVDAATLRRRGRPVALPAGMLTTGYLGPERVIASWLDFNGPDRDGATVLFDARNLERIRTMARGFEGVAVDGRRTVAVPALDGQISLLDTRTGRARVLQGRHEGDITDLAFSPDGHTLVSTGGDDGRIIVWDVASGQQRESMTGHSGRAFGPVFTPDGMRLFTVGLDSTIIAWDVTGTDRLGRSFETGGSRPLDGLDAPLDPVVGRGGRLYYIPTPDGRITFWRADDLTSARPPLGLGAPFYLVGAPDGRTLAAATGNGELMLLDESGGIKARVQVGSAPTQARLAFQPGGRLLAVATEPGVALLDARTGRRRGAPLDVAGATAITFSPDGSRLALGTADGAVEVWDVARNVLDYRSNVSGFTVFDVDFSPDGKILVAGGDDGYLRFLDARTGQQIATRVRAHDGFVLRIGFSPDGRTLFSTGTDSVVSLWDVRTHRQIGAPLPVGQGWVSATFTDDGSSLLATSTSGRAVVWSVDPSDWEARACEIAGRPLTEVEWATFLPERHYSPACG
jgi:WD40 repeat protein